MGKANIISGGPNGLYNIELVKYTSKITEKIATITARLAILEKAISDALILKNNAEVNLEEKKTAFDYAVASYALKLIEKEAVNLALSEFIKAQSEYSSAKINYSLLLQEKESKTKEKTLLQAALVTETRAGIWCADYTIDLAAGEEVGTIEINGESNQLLIYPAGDYDNLPGSLLQKTQASSTSGIFYNLAIMAGWQKWKPTYRVGEIKILYDNDRCDVCIDEATSSIQGLKINQNAPRCQQDLGELSSGFSLFCDQNPNDPIATNTDDTSIPWSQQLMADMAEINSAVNNGHAYQKDIDQYGTPEKWTYLNDGQSGDCEDFALTKLKKMLNKGYPVSAVKIVTCKTPSGEGHAYLVIQTDNGDYGLDLNYSLPMIDGNLPYTNKARQTGKSWSRPGVCLSSVPIEYMDGINGAAFVAGDRVVVEFINQNWNQPKVIGFESNPRLGAFLYGNIQCQDIYSVGTEHFRKYKLNGEFKADVPINLTYTSKIQVTLDRSEIAVLDHSMSDLNLTFYKNENDGTYEQSRQTLIPVWQGDIAAYFASYGYTQAQTSFSSFGKPCFGYSADLIYIPCVVSAGSLTVRYVAGFLQVNINTGIIIGYSFWSYQWFWPGSVPPSPREIIRYQNNFMLVDLKYNWDGIIVKMLDSSWNVLGIMSMLAGDDAYSVLAIDDIIYVAVVNGSNAPFSFKIYAYDMTAEDKFAVVKKLTLIEGQYYPYEFKLVNLGGKIGALISTGWDTIDLKMYTASVVNKTSSPLQYTGLQLIKSVELESDAWQVIGYDFTVG